MRQRAVLAHPAQVQLLEVRQMLDGTTEPPAPTFTAQDAADAAAALAAANAALIQADLDAAAAGAAASSRFNAAANAAQLAAQALRDAAATAFQTEIDAANSELADAHQSTQAAYQTAEDQSEQSYTDALDSSEQQTLAEDAASLVEYNDDLAAAEQAYQTAAQDADDLLAAARAALEAALAATEQQLDSDYDSGIAAAEAGYQSQAAGILLAYQGAVDAAESAKTASIAAANDAFFSSVSAAASTRDAALATRSGVTYDPESIAEDPTFLAAAASAQSTYDAAIEAAVDAYVDAILGAYGVYETAMSAAEAAHQSAVLIANSHRSDAYAAADVAYTYTATTASQTFSAATATAADTKAGALAAAQAAYSSTESGIAATRDQALQTAHDAFVQASTTARQAYDSELASETAFYEGEVAAAYAEYVDALNQSISTYDAAMAAANATYASIANSELETYKDAKDAAWATYESRKAAYMNGGISTFNWAVYIARQEIAYFADQITHDQLLQVYKEYAIAQAESHVSFLIQLRSANIDFLTAERAAATTLATNMADPAFEHGEAAANAAAELATTKLNETASFDKQTAEWERELRISQAFLWAEYQVAVADAEKAKFIAGTQANLTYSLAEEGLALTREKANIAADAAFNDAVTQAEATQARTLANAAHTRTLAYTAAERAYVGEVAAADEALALASIAAEVAFVQTVLSAQAPYGTSVTSAQLSLQSSVATARASAISAAAGGNADVAFVATTWSTFEIATANAQVTKSLASLTATTTFDQADLAAWQAGAAAEAAAATAWSNAQADVALAWAQGIAAADLQAELADIDASTANLISLNAAGKTEAEQLADADSNWNRRMLQSTASQAVRDANTANTRDKEALEHERDREVAQYIAENAALVREINASTAQGLVLIEADKNKAIETAEAARDEVDEGAEADKEIALAAAEETHRAEIHGAFVHLQILRESSLANFEGNPGPGIGAALNWMYNDGLDHAVNFMTGWMDAGTGGWWSYLGQGSYLTQYVDYNSMAYGGGQVVGTVHGFVLGMFGGPCSPGWAGAVARMYTTTMSGVGIVEAGHHALQGEVGIGDILAMAPVLGRLAGRLTGFNCFVAGTPVATGWTETPDLASAVPLNSAGCERTGWLVMGLGTVVLTTTVASRLRRSDEEEAPRTRRNRRRAVEGWERFDERHEIPMSRASFDDTGLANRGGIACVPEKDREMPLASIRKAEEPAPDPMIAISEAAPARPTRRRVRSAIAAVVSACGLLLGGLCFWQSGIGTGGSGQALASLQGPGLQSPGAMTTPRSASGPTLATIPIEQIRPGMRVLADNPELQQPIPDRAIEPEETRLVQLVQKKPDGSSVEITRLFDRTELWSLALARLKSQNSPSLSAEVRNFEGADLLVPLLKGEELEFDLPEFGVRGPATIVSIEPCPEIEPASGRDRRLVTTTFRHTSAAVLELELAGPSTTVLGVTANHPMWSEDRREFVPAGELKQGERLRQANGGVIRVASIRPLPGRHTVYNFEVDAEHVYYVGLDGVLAHNTYVYWEVVNKEIRYVGITEKFGRRFNEHKRSGRFIEEIDGLQNITRREARAMEQTLIDHYRKQGALSNKINSISPKRKHLYATELEWAQAKAQELGLLW